MATFRKIVLDEHGKPKRVAPDRDGRPALRWYAQVYVGRHPTTRRPQFVTKTAPRKKDVQQWARKQEGLKDKNIRPATTRETFADYLRRWLPVHAGKVRESTSYNTSKTLGKWVINPRNGASSLLGGKQLRKLTVQDFDRLYIYMVEQGMQPRAIRYLHGILKQALKAAVKKGDLPRNPAEFATVPKPDHKAEIVGDDEADEGRVEALDRVQADRFLKAARALDWYSALWHMLLTTGLRPGEALALKWRNADLEKKEVRVRATLNRVGVKGWKLTRPKTKRGRRTVPLPEVTMQELRQWKTQQSKERLVAGSQWQDYGFVFTNRHGGPLNLSNLARRSFRRVMERAGLGEYYGPEPIKPRSGPTAKRPFRPSLRIYALRHTFATLLLADGVPLLVVSRLLGHTSIQLTADVYSHVLPQERDEAAEHFNRMFRIA